MSGELGLLFPAGGRVEPEQMIGRNGDVSELVQRLSELMHTTVSGRRRIGKTTVCNAACRKLQEKHGFLVVEVEAPEQSTASGLCQLVVDRCTRIDVAGRAARRGLRAARPLVEAWLKDQGIPLDLAGLGPSLPPEARRGTLELPLLLARKRDTRLVFFIDELQRVVDYGDGHGLVSDLVDIYAGNDSVVVLVDGSNERTIESLMGAPFGLAKLTSRLPLEERIPRDQWERPLAERFVTAGIEIDQARLEKILDFGDGRPYETMSAALYVAYGARRYGVSVVDDHVLATGLEEARARIAEDS